LNMPKNILSCKLSKQAQIVVKIDDK